MPRSKIPEGELVRFIVKTRHCANQTAEFERNLVQVRNLVNRIYRDYIGYTLRGDHRLKSKGEAVFAAETLRDRKRAPRATKGAGVKSHLRYVGEGAFLWEGSRVVVLGLPASPLKSVGKIDYVLADRFTPVRRDVLLEILKSSGATLVGLPEVAAEASLRGLPAQEMHVGGTFHAEGLAVHAVPCVSSQDIAPCGFVVEMDGVALYHAGRTALTSEMRTTGDLFHVDVMTLPVGRSVPMSPWAVTLAVEWIGAKHLVPWAAEEGVFLKELQAHVGDMARLKVLAVNEHWELEPDPTGTVT